MTTTINIEVWKREGAAHGARAMLVVWDTFPWPWEPYPVYVMPGENITERFAALDGVTIQRVTAFRLVN